MTVYTMPQRSAEWFDIRQWVLTGTKFKEIMGVPYPKKVPSENAVIKVLENATWGMIGEEFAEVPDIYVNDAMQRGIDLEPLAIAEYERLTGETVTEIWFVTINEWHGLSPDWLIWKELDPGVMLYHKAVEVKCPGGKNFVKWMIEDKIPDDYLWQVVNYFLVADTIQELDFVIYNPEFYLKEKQMHIINVTREDLADPIARAEERLKLFRPIWEENILKLTKVTNED